MKLVFLSNFMSPHQEPLCNALADAVEQFYFIQTKKIGQMRSRFGWGQDALPPYVLDFKDDPDNCAALIDGADVVMLGSASYELVRNRIRAGKYTVVCSERIYKDPLPFWKWPHHKRLMLQKYARYKKVYLFAHSAFAAGDYHKTNAFGDRMLQFGYFPKTVYLPQESLQNRAGNRLLWAGRMIPYKHPEAAVEIAKRLRADGVDFSLEMIGEGPELPSVIARIAAEDLSDCVTLSGALPYREVREKMAQSNIFLATSDRGEGWGAVINEAMNAGMAVVADSQMGAAPCLIQDGKNGWLYRTGDFETLYRKVRRLLEEPRLARETGENAYHTVVDLWNAETAAKRAVAVFEAMLSGKEIPVFESGPCKKAEILKDRWYES